MSDATNDDNNEGEEETLCRICASPNRADIENGLTSRHRPQYRLLAARFKDVYGEQYSVRELSTHRIYHIGERPLTAAFKLDKNLIARVLVDAGLMGTYAAATKHSVSTRAIERYRARLAEDSELEQLVDALSEEILDAWVDEAKQVRTFALRKLTELIDRSNNLPAVCNALETVNNVIVTNEVLKAGVPGAITTSGAVVEENGRRNLTNARTGIANKQDAALDRAAARFGREPH